MAWRSAFCRSTLMAQAPITAARPHPSTEQIFDEPAPQGIGNGSTWAYT